MPSIAIRLGGVNTFNNNRAYAGGSIYNDEGSSFSPPQDGGELIFQNNLAEVSAKFTVVVSCRRILQDARGIVFNYLEMQSAVLNEGKLTTETVATVGELRTYSFELSRSVIGLTGTYFPCLWM